MALNGYLNRRSFLFFTVASLTGSYFIAKSNTLRAKSQQTKEKSGPDFGVDPSRSGGGI